MNTALASCLTTNGTNLADTYVEDYNPINSYGSQNVMSTSTSSYLSSTKHRAFIRFEFDIPESAIIEKVELNLRTYYVQYSRAVDIYEVDSNSWNESITWNSQPAYGDYITSITEFTTGMNVDRTYTIDVTDWLLDRIDNEYDEISLCLRSSDEGSAYNNIQFFTKEHTTASNRPVFVITYILVGPTNLISPLDDTTFTEYPLLEWSESTNAIRYRLQIYGDEDLNSSVFDDWIDDLSYQTSGLPNGTYYWCVYGNDGTNDGETTDTRYFHLDIPISDPGDDEETPSNPVYPDLTDDNPVISVDGQYTGDLQNVLFRNLFQLNDKIGIPTWSLILIGGLIGVWKRRPELVIFCGLLFLFLLFFGYKLSMVAVI